MSSLEGGPDLSFSQRVDSTAYPEIADFSLENFACLVARAWKLQKGPLPTKVEVVWMAEEEHNRLHQRFLNDPTPTDVITFPYGDADLFGEIVVNLDMARIQARARALPLEQEVALYVVHGALHLLGLDDRSDAEKVQMRAAEAAVLERDPS